MSRVGNLPINVPGGVEIKVEDGFITVKGPKGTLTQDINKDMIVEINDGVLEVKRPTEQKKHKAMHGLYRALINNMIIGVTNGFEKVLEIVGVGYRAQKQGNTLVLNLGYSHPIEMNDPEGIETVVEGQNKIIVKGINKQAVGAHAANIRAKRSPEPYKGKGIRYQGEYIRIKEGKSGK